jgi:predicted  nucleic acid-binding Zn-ribbon protein
MNNKRRELESRVRTIGIHLKASKCHDRKAYITELSNICKVQSALSLTEIAKLTGIPKATLGRWFDQKERTSAEAEFEQLPQEYRALQDELHRLEDEKSELGGRCAIAEDAMFDMERSVKVLMAR